MRWLSTGVAVLATTVKRCPDEKIEEVCAEGKEESPDCEACFQ
jgi:hypothetical protein